MATKKSISFLGCGWLGHPSAIKLAQKGIQVKVSTTSATKIEQFTTEGLQPYLIHLTPESSEITLIQEFLHVDTLVINIPPGKSSEVNFHPSQIQFLKPFIEDSPIKHIIYVSATSVYPEHNQMAYETDVKNASEAVNKKLALAEDIIKSIPNKHITILRYGGLVGGSRNLLKFFAGKTDVEGGHIPVNLIHQNDAVNILCETVIQEVWDDTFNVCAPLHPSKKIFYSNLAKKFDAIAPQFKDEDSSPFKIINTDKIIQKLNYQFEFENPLDFEYDR